jgi:hypothetical protein
MSFLLVGEYLLGGRTCYLGRDNKSIKERMSSLWRIHREQRSCASLWFLKMSHFPIIHEDELLATAETN